MPVGRVAGGEVMALGGIVVGQGGSEGNVPTLLVAGEDFWIGDAIGAKERQAEQLERDLQKLRNAAGPLALRGKKRLTAEQKEIVEKLLKQISEADARLEDLRDDIAKMQEESRLRAKPEIVVNATVYPETTLAIRGKSLRVREAVRGPLRASVVAGKVDLSPL